MKTIYEKALEVIETKANEYFNSQLKSSLLSLLEDLKVLEKEATFEESAGVLMKHLGNPELYHPHHTVIVSNARAELLEGVKSTGYIEDYVPD